MFVDFYIQGVLSDYLYYARDAKHESYWPFDWVLCISSFDAKSLHIGVTLNFVRKFESQEDYLIFKQTTDIDNILIIFTNSKES